MTCHSDSDADSIVHCTSDIEMTERTEEEDEQTEPFNDKSVPSTESNIECENNDIANDGISPYFP